ncbi:DNA replication/repair protein RecF [Bdellovibrionota bacterium]
MSIQEVTLRQFKNFSDQTIRLNPLVTLICGENGEGKTNLLEGLYYLNTLRPLRSGDLIRWGEERAYLTAVVKKDEVEDQFSVLLNKNSPRVIKIGEKQINPVENYLKHFSVIAFLPQHLQIVQGEPAGRRRYLDRAVYTNNFKYLSDFRRYQHLLAQRNARLKSFALSRDKEVWDEQFLEAGNQVINGRIEFIKRIAPIVSRIYSSLSASNQSLVVQYDMSKDGMFEGEEEIEKQSRWRLQSVAEEERIRQFSQWGPHRHDLKILLNDRPLAYAGSQGQQRIAILALKLAEVELLSCNQIYPLVLLDDLASELDPSRRAFVMSYLQRHPYQVVITACDPSDEWLKEEVNSLMKYKIQDGQIKI